MAIVPTMIKKVPIRHEIKHQVTKAEDLVLRLRLRKVLSFDSHGKDGRYLVTSLYFDDEYDRAYRAKIEGLNYKEKFRIRYYGDDLSFIKLEKKYKRGDLSAKDSVKLSKDEVEKIIEGDIDFLLKSKEELKKEFYVRLKNKLAPVSVVRYEREAFVYPYGNVRITFDSDISKIFEIKDFLDQDADYVQLEENTILEIKYDRYLPDTIRALIDIDTRRTSYSKYAISRIGGRS